LRIAGEARERSLPDKQGATVLPLELRTQIIDKLSASYISSQPEREKVIVSSWIQALEDGSYFRLKADR
jgi:hypothetical protein